MWPKSDYFFELPTKFATQLKSIEGFSEATFSFFFFITIFLFKK